MSPGRKQRGPEGQEPPEEGSWVWEKNQKCSNRAGSESWLKKRKMRLEVRPVSEVIWGQLGN